MKNEHEIDYVIYICVRDGMCREQIIKKLIQDHEAYRIEAENLIEKYNRIHERWLVTDTHRPPSQRR